MDFSMEIAANWKLVVANFGFWSAMAPGEQGLASADAARTLAAIKTIWNPRHPDLPLPIGALVTGRA